MVAILESLQGGRTLEFTSCLAFSHIHLDSLREFKLIFHDIHICLLCSHEFTTVSNLPRH